MVTQYAILFRTKIKACFSLTKMHKQNPGFHVSFSLLNADRFKGIFSRNTGMKLNVVSQWLLMRGGKSSVPHHCSCNLLLTSICSQLCGKIKSPWIIKETEL